MSLRFPAVIVCAALLGALAPAPAARAVNVQPDRVPNRGVFGIELDQERQFYGRADHVVSVSLQEYSTEAFIVTEVVVDMANSSQQLRLYSLRPLSSDDAAEALNGARGASNAVRGAEAPAAAVLPSQIVKAQEKLNTAQAYLPQRPAKAYPFATHAHTVEYLVRDRAELVAFFKRFRDLFTGKEVAAGEGDSVSGAGASLGTSSSKLTVSRLGGTVFSVKP